MECNILFERYIYDRRIRTLRMIVDGGESMVKPDAEKTIHGLSYVIRDQCFWLGMGRCCPAAGSPCMGIERR